MMDWSFLQQPLFSGPGGELRFASPLFLSLLLVLPLVVAVALYRERVRPAVLRFSAVQLLRRAGGSAGRLRAVLPALRTLALVAVVLALARPQYGRVERVAHSDGIDIMLVLDVSLSMRANDLYPDRLEAAKQVLGEFVTGRKGDRIGLVIFGSEAATLVPLTFDYPVLVQFIGRISFQLLDGNSTAIGMGLSTALARLRDSEAKSKVVILLTDGENNAGRIAPLVAAEAAKTMGTRVYTIGVGSDATMSPFRNAREPGIDEEMLTRIAEMTGGLYFRATDEKRLSGIYEQIDRLEKSRVESTQFDNFNELAPWLLLAALLLLGTEIALKSTRLVKVP